MRGLGMSFLSWYGLAFSVLLLAPLAASAVLYRAFWKEDRRESLAEGRPPCPLRLIAWGIVQSWAALFLVYALYPLRSLALWRADAWRRESDSGGDGEAGRKMPPLILVHPTFHNAGAWLLWLPVLHRHGYRHLHFFEYSCVRESFASVAQRLARMVDAVVTDSPGEKPLLLGVSLGALLSRAALSQVGDVARRECGGLITLSCPHQGTRLATFFPVGIVREISFQGPAVEWMADGENLPEIPYTAFFSTLDEIVQPSQSLRPPAGWVSRRTAPLSHMGTLLHSPTIRAVVEELDRLCVS